MFVECKISILLPRSIVFSRKTKSRKTATTRHRKRTGLSRWTKYRIAKAKRKALQDVSVPFPVDEIDDGYVDDDPPVANTRDVPILREAPVNLPASPVDMPVVSVVDDFDSGVSGIDGSDYDVIEDDDDVDERDCHASGSFYIQRSLSLRNQIARWAVFFSIPAVAVSVLLKILVLYGVGDDLPKDCRTLLKTARVVQTKLVSGGEYFHFGLSEGICDLLSGLKQSVFDSLDDVLKIIVSTDGLPVFKSSNTHVWPISSCLFVENKCSRPFVVGLFYGVDKALKVNDFLSDFVRDFRDCVETGFICRKRTFKVALHCIVADAPARAFLKNVISHTGKRGCERCRVHNDKKHGKAYNDENAVLRTDESLVNGKEKGHVKGPSPWSSVGVKLISHFVLDYMHLVLLGVTRKLMFMWLEGEKNEVRKQRKYRLTVGQANGLSLQLTSFAEGCPKEFSRKPRSLSNIRMFKATELRTLLLYTGLVAFHCDAINNKVYWNFLRLSCAMRIMLSAKYCSDRSLLKKARKALKKFVPEYRGIYGSNNVVYNVHNLIHLYSDCKMYGSLNTVNAFPFENYLQTFKRLVRSGRNTMQQLIRRLDELQRFSLRPCELFPSHTTTKYLHQHHVDIPECLKRYRCEVRRQYKAVEYGGIRFSVFQADSCIRLPDGSVGKIMNVFEMKDNTTAIVYREYMHRRTHFKIPLNSEAVGVSRVHMLSPYLLVASVKQCKKAWLMPMLDSNWSVAIDLLEDAW